MASILSSKCVGAKLLAAVIACFLKPTVERIQMVAKLKGVGDYRWVLGVVCARS